MQFIKSILVLALAASSAAFSPVLPGLSSVRGASGVTKLSMAEKGKVNFKIELESEKVANMVECPD